MTVGPRAARVRRRAQLAQKPQLVERGLELAPAALPLDARQRAEGGLDGRPLPLAGEVRAQSGAEISRPAHVERLPVPVAEDVRPGRRRGTGDERALRLQAPGARCRQLDEVGDRLRAALLREPDQRDQDLRRGGGVGERPMARRQPMSRRSARAARARSGPSGRRGAAARARPCRRPGQPPACPSGARRRGRESPCRTARCGRRAPRRRRTRGSGGRRDPRPGRRGDAPVRSRSAP